MSSTRTRSARPQSVYSDDVFTGGSPSARASALSETRQRQSRRDEVRRAVVEPHLGIS